ncbi:DMT family transporter [Clostridium botulinum]|uniref:DMT family transporter n=1 Tax=Clostridium botulinum TaxID=1491 RepID=A0A9Q1ZDD8_CLOBO|nr:DMT family transporter [Clostridium botulinum]AEB76760.1 conserved hypothetical protein [Clostridium botulinum BKT015925]KEH98748.1 hypothetical protein Z953_12500 [Clostridium botulinum D str. 16868]KEI02475.1 hypothetical protein Y848_07250 [Clostridium botulinum C/D str. Sp77]KLU76327.1 hypothetical protein CBC3_04185 [Clostridium botulinum V891]KOA75030.1 hypothetical protein ADU78_09510 [Clostridium botulinum]
MLYLLLSFISGSIIIISMTLNARLADHIGLLEGTLINFISGFIPALIYLLINYNNFNISKGMFLNVPFWMYLGGAVGVLVVCVSNFVMPKIPTIYTTLLIFMGQLFVGTIVDYFTNMMISKGKLIGGALIIAGLFYNFKVDSKCCEEAPNVQEI